MSSLEVFHDPKYSEYSDEQEGKHTFDDSQISFSRDTYFRERVSRAGVATRIKTPAQFIPQQIWAHVRAYSREVVTPEGIYGFDVSHSGHREPDSNSHLYTSFLFLLSRAFPAVLPHR